MTQETINSIILFLPLVVGGIIAAINGERINDTTEKKLKLGQDGPKRRYHQSQVGSMA